MTTMEHGKERPVSICLRLDPSLVEKLDTVRMKHHTSRTAVIAEAVKMYVDNDGEPFSVKDLNERIANLEHTLSLLTQAFSDNNKTIEAQSVMIDKLLNKLAFERH